MNWQIDQANEVTSRSRASSEASAEGWAIGHICDQTGLSPRTVRYYEELGLLPGVKRRQGARRVYGPDELERLRFIQRLKALGLSLQEIKELNALYALAGSTRTMLQRLNGLLDSHLDDLDARIGELTDLRDEMRRYRERVVVRVDRAPDVLPQEIDPVSSRGSEEPS